MKRAAIFASITIVLLWGSSSMLQGQELEEGTWSGTRVRISPRGNNPQNQRISLEVARIPDPHSAWRPGIGRVLTATLVVPQGRFQVSDLRLQNELLSFSYRQETEVTCRLERQPDGTYQGDCLVDGDSRRFRVTLSPPKGPA